MSPSKNDHHFWIYYIDWLIYKGHKIQERLQQGSTSSGFQSGTVVIMGSSASCNPKPDDIKEIKYYYDDEISNEKLVSEYLRDTKN